MAEKTLKKWNIDLSAWKTMRDVHDFNKAQQSGDLEKVFVAYSDIIKAWEFSPDPSNPDAYMGIEPKQWKAVQGHVREAVTDFFTKTSDVTPDAKKWNIDLSAWKTMRDVHEFNKAQQSGDLEKVFVAYSDIIKTWEFAPDPSNPDAYMGIEPMQWKVVQKAVQNTVGNFFQKADE